MKILMFGRGVISTQYGWALEKAGHTVEFYVRPGRKSEYGTYVALNILDARTKFKGIEIKENWPITLREDIPLNHDYDLIIVSVQHYHFKSATDYLAKRVGKATVLVFNNFWTEPKLATSSLPFEQLVWGFPVAGGGFDSNGVLNATILSKVIFGTFGTEPTDREMVVRNLFTSSGFKVDEKTDFRDWLLVHFAMNAGIHIQTLQAGSLLNAFKSSNHWKNIILNVRELLPVLQARGVDLKKSPELNLLRLPPWMISFAMRMILKISPPMKMIIECHSNIEELKSYCRDVLEEARKLKISVPRLEDKESYFSNKKK